MTDDDRGTSARRVPRLPERGWLPDPSHTDLERFWDGTRWTGRTRDRHTRAETPPPAEMVYRPRAWLHEPQRRPRAAWRRFSMRRVMVATASVVAVAGLWHVHAVSEGDAVPVTDILADAWGNQAPSAPAAWPGSEPAEPAHPADPAHPVDPGVVVPLADDGSTVTDSGYPAFGSTDLVRTLEAGLTAQDDTIRVSAWDGRGGFDAINDAMFEALSQNPYAYVTEWQVMSLSTGFEITPSYTYDAVEAERRRAATRTAAADALAASGASAATTDVDKVTAIHDWIVDYASYDMGVFESIERGETGPRVAQSQEAYGILVMGTAVCNGYAMAFTAMAEQAGLNAVVVTGADSAGLTGGSHAWNKVLIDGEWLLVDATWDDPIGMPQGETLRDYLLVPDGSPLLSTRTTGTDWMVDENLGAFGA